MHIKHKPYITILTILTVSWLCSNCKSQSAGSSRTMMAVMEVKEPIPGVCNNDQVVVILPFGNGNQEEAKPPISEKEIEKKLNEEVAYLAGKSDYEDKGMVRVIINCKGEMVQCEIANKTQSPELDKEIVAIFASLKPWTVGKINGKAFDTVNLYSFEIEDGNLILK